MKQQCHISFVYASWLILAGGLIFYVFRGEYLQACFWVFFIAVFLRLYVRYFPSLSRLMGYGSVEDQSAADVRPLEYKGFSLYRNRMSLLSACEKETYRSSAQNGL